MRQDRFSLYRRGSVWYVQFYNPHTRKYLSGRSTGESNRNAALLTVAEWLRDGLPEPARGSRRLRELLDLDLALSIIRRAPLTPDDAERLVRILEDRQLIEDTVIKAGPGSEPFTGFLERFWDYEQSPYVRERLAHGQRISRRHCYDARNRLDFYWRPYFGKEKRLSEDPQVRPRFVLPLAQGRKGTKGQYNQQRNICRDSGPALGRNKRVDPCESCRGPHDLFGQARETWCLVRFRSEEALCALLA